MRSERDSSEAHPDDVTRVGKEDDFDDVPKGLHPFLFEAGPQSEHIVEVLYFDGGQRSPSVLLGPELSARDPSYPCS